MEEEIKTAEEKKTNLNKLVKILAVIALLVVIIVLIIIKTQKPDFPLRTIFLIGGSTLVISLIVYFGFHFRKEIEDKFKEKKKELEDRIPNPMSEEEVKLKIKKALTNSIFRDHIKEHLETKPHNINKNTIYEFPVKRLHKPGITYIIVNANYPEKLTCILENPTDYKLNKMVNAMSSRPIDEPDFEVSELFNPFTQTYQKTEKKTHHAKKEAKEERKEDLA